MREGQNCTHAKASMPKNEVKKRARIWIALGMLKRKKIHGEEASRRDKNDATHVFLACTFYHSTTSPLLLSFKLASNQMRLNLDRNNVLRNPIFE
jgi:hypothetical protein